jgi:hypothetical protein
MPAVVPFLSFCQLFGIWQAFGEEPGAGVDLDA